MTLTYTLTYLSLYVHRQNRLYQSSLLAQQKALLTSLYDPPTEVYDEPAYEIRPAGLTEQLKDRWNREIETGLRRLQEKNWEESRLWWENQLGNVWGKAKDSEVGEQVKAAGEQAAASLADARGKASEALKDAQTKAGEIAKDAESKARQAGRDADKKTRELAKDAQVKAREIARDVKHKAVETKDALVDKAVETRDAIVDKAQDLKKDAKDLKREATVKTKEVTGQKRLLEL